MALYKVLERSFVNNALLEEGAIVEYSGEASTNLELIKANEAKKIDPTVVINQPE